MYRDCYNELLGMTSLSVAELRDFYSIGEEDDFMNPDIGLQTHLRVLDGLIDKDLDPFCVEHLDDTKKYFKGHSYLKTPGKRIFVNLIDPNKELCNRLNITYY